MLIRSRSRRHRRPGLPALLTHTHGPTADRSLDHGTDGTSGAPKPHAGAQPSPTELFPLEVRQQPQVGEVAGGAGSGSATGRLPGPAERAWSWSTVGVGSEGASAADQDPGRHLELADEAMPKGDVDGVAAHLSAAIRGFTAAGECRPAALACVRLGNLFANYMGNKTAARAWFRRGARLLENEPPCLEQGWVAVAAMGCDVDDPAELLANAELALECARRFGDVNLECKALADGGLALVQAGDITRGMSMLDEAMALVCGPADDVAAAGKSVCSFFTACCYAADFERAGSWAEPLRRQGLIGTAPGVQVFLNSHCDSVQATALCELGRWGEAEVVLVRAMAQFEEQMPMPSWHPAITLAELRIRQGRLGEAEILLLGKDGYLQALLPAAHLHLARGDHDLARATALRGLRAIAADRLRAVDLLTVLVDTELGTGRIDAAQEALRDLMTRAEGLDVPGLAARVAAVHARVLVATGDTPGAIGCVESALDRLGPTDVPVLRATLLVDLVRLHDAIGNRAAATVEAGHASATLAGLDIGLASRDIALLGRYGGPTSEATESLSATGAPARPSSDSSAPTATPATEEPGPREATLARNGRWWVVAYAGTSARLPATKGLRYLAQLLANPGVERHALDLVDQVEGIDPDTPATDRRQLGDAGEHLDAQARAAYRHRIEAVRGEIEDAVAIGAEDRAEALQGELDQLVAELSRAFGLGGRSRQASSAAERARLNVTRALRAATAKVGEALPEAGGALDRRVRTGIYCAYEPDPADAIAWIVQS